MTAIFFSSLIGPIPVSVVMRENHMSSLGITENPIETGASVTDHAYVNPKSLTLEFADGNAAATYNALVRFQESRVPFVVVSGLFIYTNMLIKSLSATRDAATSRILDGRAELQEIIIVSTSYTSSEGSANDAQSQGAPGGAGSTQSARPTSERAGDAVTADRAAGTTMRGDSGTVTPPANENTSILAGMFGGGSEPAPRLNAGQL